MERQKPGLGQSKFRFAAAVICNCCLLLLALFSANALAGNAGAGTLNTVHFMGNGVVIVYTNGARSGVPSCASNNPSRFALDGTSAGGKVQLAGPLSAYATGKRVTIIGADNCSVYGDSETISYFYTND